MKLSCFRHARAGDAVVGADEQRLANRLATDQGRTEGMINALGVEKSHQCRNYFLQHGTFAPE